MPTNFAKILKIGKKDNCFKAKGKLKDFKMTVHDSVYLNIFSQ